MCPRRQLSWQPCADADSRGGILSRPSAIGQQSRFLPQRDDAAWPAFHRVLKRRPRDAIVACKGDQLLDAAVLIVPLLDTVRQIKLAPRSHGLLENGTGTRKGSCVAQ